MLRRILTIITMLFLCTFESGAQNVLFFNSKQGLSNTCIHNIYEDSRHNIWIGTQNGLNRYDGTKINVYRHIEGDSQSLLQDETTFALEYDRNNILIGTGKGIQVFNYATNKFQSLPFVGINGDTLRVRVIGFYKINDNGKERIMMTFTGYGNGEIVKDAKGNFQLKHINEFNADNNYNPTFFYQDKRNNVWTINNHHLYLRKGKKMKLYPDIKSPIKLVESTTGNLYAATDNNGLYLYNVKKDHFEMIASPAELGGVLYGINPWRDTRIFLCTDGGGLRVYNEKTKQITESSIKVNDFNTATSNVKDAICDSYGNVWVGIYFKGVMLKPHTESNFEYIGRHSITKNSLGTNSVFTLTKADDNKNLWVAVDNDGLYYLSADGTHSQHYSKETVPNMPVSFTTISSLSSSRLLLGTYYDGLWSFNNGNFSLITKEINQVFDTCPADNGCYWIGSMGGGLYYFNPSDNSFKQYIANYNSGAEGVKIIHNNYIYSVKQFGNKVFVGTSDGLIICQYDGNGVISKKSTIMLRTYSIKHMEASVDKKQMYLGTNNGLYVLDIKTNELTNYSTTDGLPNNSVESVLVDGSNVWLGTDDGLSCFDSKDKSFANFFTDDGIQDNEFNKGATVSMNGFLYFGGVSGLTYFDPKVIIAQDGMDAPMKLKLVDLSIAGKTIHCNDDSRDYEILEDVLDDCHEIHLSHKDNHFVIQLGIEGLFTQHVTYEYSIDGKDWTNQGEASRLYFDNLKPGKHTLRIRAVSYNGVSEERELIIKVKAAWYESWWAQILYFLLFALICYLGYLYVKRLIAARKVLARHQQEQEINEARIQFFMNISHEIRTPMTLILAPLEKLIRMDKDPECQRSYKLIKQNANRILRLINQMMDVRKIDQGKYQLDYHKVEIVSFIQNAFDVFRTQAESRNINYNFNHDGINTLTVEVDPENIDKIIMNLLSNAFKFTPDGGSISVDLFMKDDSNFGLTITDTGGGIADEDKQKIFERFYSAGHKNGYIGTGIGLNLTAMLVKLHKGEIVVKDNPQGKGTQFDISIPTISGVDTSNAEEYHIEDTDTVEKNALVVPVTDLKQTDGTSDSSSETMVNRIVLVEDDTSIRQYVNSELSADAEVVDFSDGQQAWDYIIANPTCVSLVVSDIMMPVMDGLTLCQKVKSNFNTNHIPILLMTALGSDADRIAGITNGADAYISKPFNIDVLRTTALGLLRSRQLLQGRFKSEKLQEDTIEKKELESPDENLMRRIMKVINDNLDNDELSVEMIADIVGISRVHFYRKMKDMTGQSPREFVKYVRLKEAARLLSTKKMDIAGVSIACGFKSPSSFSTYFKALYGLSPSEWMKKQAASEDEQQEK